MRFELLMKQMILDRNLLRRQRRFGRTIKDMENTKKNTHFHKYKILKAYPKTIVDIVVPTNAYIRIAPRFLKKNLCKRLILCINIIQNIL